MFPNRHQARSRYRAESNLHREILRKPYLYIVHISLYPLSAERTVCPGSVVDVDTPQLPRSRRRSPSVTSGASCERSRACPGWVAPGDSLLRAPAVLSRAVTRLVARSCGQPGLSSAGARSSRQAEGTAAGLGQLLVPLEHAALLGALIKAMRSELGSDLS